MNESSTLNYDNEEIDILELVKGIWQSRLLICCVVLFFATTSVLLAINTPNKYLSSSLMRVVDNNDSMQSGSDLNVFGSIAGLGMQSSNAKTDFIIATVKSRDFFKHILSVEDIDLSPVLLAFMGYDETAKKIIFDTDIYDVNKKVLIFKDSETPTFQYIYTVYLNMLNINQNKAGFINIQITHESPEFAFKFLSLIINEINILSREKALNDSEASLNYLYEKLSKVQKIEIKNSINELITSKIKLQMMAEVKDNYSLEPLDSAFIPDIKSSPNRARMSIMGTVLGFFIGIILSILRYFIFIKKSFTK